MKLRRSLLAAGVPLAAGLSLTPAVRASSSVAPVTVRVEGATRTLLAARTVTAPATGSITKGGTPAGICPTDSAAGALAAATHGRWNGTYYTGLGIDVSTILGTTLSFSKGSYWGFYVNDRVAPKGVCATSLRRGESLLFAPVPAKGATPMPIVVRAPRTVTAGRPFDVRAFVHTGKGNATKPVRGARVRVTIDASTRSQRPRLAESRRGGGVLRLRISGVTSARATLVISARGEIRSAAQTIKVLS